MPVHQLQQPRSAQRADKGKARLQSPRAQDLRQAAKPELAPGARPSGPCQAQATDIYRACTCSQSRSRTCCRFPAGLAR